MAIRLYDLAGAEEDSRFSPNCWRTRLALAHKDLPVETIPWRFTDKDAIAFSDQGAVPVMVDGDRTVVDSWTIAEYLEDIYPDRPSLFGGPIGRAYSRFVNHWANAVVHPAVAKIIILDVFSILHAKDKAYFRQSREQRFGMTLEQFVADREQKIAQFRQALQPMRATLADQPFLSGNGPTYADYAVFGAFQWARTTSPAKLLDTDDPVAGWRERILGLFDGLAGRAKGYPC